MRSRWHTALVVAVVLLLAAGVAATAVEVRRVIDERDEARLAVASASQSLVVAGEVLDVTSQSRARYKRLAAHRDEVVRGLRKQVDWDKSHLLDCWTALVRVLPPSHMRGIFGGPLGYLADAARDGGVVGRYVRRCASDAVP